MVLNFVEPLNLTFNNSPFEVLISSGYKWMLSGYGVAFLLVKKDFYKNKFLKSNS